MAQKKQRKPAVFFLILAGILCSLIGAGFHTNAAALGEPDHQDLKVLADVIDMLEKNYVDSVDTKDMILKGVEGMVSSLDPHSQLLPPEAYEELQIDTRGEFGGVGLVVTMEDDLLTVVSPIEGSPAEKAGMAPGDIILEVDGEPAQGMMLWEAVKKMRGPEGEIVSISVRREGVKEPMVFTLVREVIPIESVKHLPLEDGYGYLRITSFQDHTTEDMTKALSEMESDGVPLRGLILDLRDNPGGLLTQAIEVSDFFLDEGTIVSTKGRFENKDYKAHRNEEEQFYPIVVLVNGGSASASEIVAGALQDHKRGIILGTPTFGKGSVQTVAPLQDGYGVKFTIYRYYTPNGRSIQARGIVPDIEVQQQSADGTEETAAGILREKDLENHLEAQPLNGEEDVLEDALTGDEEQNGEPEKQRRRSENRYGELTLEELRNDYQVMRALEILSGYQVFSDASG